MTNKIVTQPARDYLLSDEGTKMTMKFYSSKKETSPQSAFARAAHCYSMGDDAFAQRIYDYASQLHFMYASPVLSNAIDVDWESLVTEQDRAAFFKNNMKGLPISCFLTYVADSLPSLIAHTEELRWMSVKGGGVGGHWSSVRSVSKKAPGPIPFLKTVDADMTAYMQGVTRKGSYAAYMDISHPDIVEFMGFRKPSGGDVNRKCLNLHNAVNITDTFLAAVFGDADWNLIDPGDRTIRKTVKARELWQNILDTRRQTGEPYICFIDECNRQLPQHLKDTGLSVNGSNLCSEIILPTSEDRSAVCCLSSANAEYYDAWKNTSMIRDLVRFLDNVLQVFIWACPDELIKARMSAIAERSIGLGVMGFHSYLQSKSVVFGSVSAMSINRAMFKRIRKEADLEADLLCAERGPCGDGYKAGKAVRLSHKLAIAPNASSSILCNTSPSIEPWSSNAVIRKTRGGSAVVVNPYFDSVIGMYALKNDLSEKWIKKQMRLVAGNQGSVQDLEWLDDHNKEVFKTAIELDMRWVIEHARIRQAFIDQAQSVNLFFAAGADKKYVNAVHLTAFAPADERGGVPLKSLYYYRTKSIKQGEKVSTAVVQNKLKDKTAEPDECLSCHG